MSICRLITLSTPIHTTHHCYSRDTSHPHLLTCMHLCICMYNNSNSRNAINRIIIICRTILRIYTSMVFSNGSTDTPDGVLSCVLFVFLDTGSAEEEDDNRYHHGHCCRPHPMTVNPAADTRTDDTFHGYAVARPRSVIWIVERGWRNKGTNGRNSVRITINGQLNASQLTRLTRCSRNGRTFINSMSDWSANQLSMGMPFSM